MNANHVCASPVLSTKDLNIGSSRTQQKLLPVSWRLARAWSPTGWSTRVASCCL